MAFGAKKETREPPVDRVRAMMRGGMSEKDIVRQLKAEGFSFGEIEKALMSAVKAGASPLPTGAEFGRFQPPSQMESVRVPEPISAPIPVPVRAQAPQEEYMPAPQPYEQYPPAPAYPTYPEYPPEGELQPEVIMEELVESVVEEKFEKFSANMKRLEDEIEKIRSNMGAIREEAEQKPAPELPKDLSDRLDDIEGRIGGLERSFKQLLPALQQNVEAISRLFAERRQQQSPSFAKPNPPSQTTQYGRRP